MEIVLDSESYYRVVLYQKNVQFQNSINKLFTDETECLRYDVRKLMTN